MSGAYVVSPVARSAKYFHSLDVSSSAARTPVFLLEPFSYTLGMKPMLAYKLGRSSIFQTYCTSLWFNINFILLSCAIWPVDQSFFIKIDLLLVFPFNFSDLLIHHCIFLFQRNYLSRFLLSHYQLIIVLQIKHHNDIQGFV